MKELLLKLFDFFFEQNNLSQKGEGHGYGMKIINQIVYKYKGKIDYQVLEKEVKISIIMLINNAN